MGGWLPVYVCGPVPGGVLWVEENQKRSSIRLTYGRGDHYEVQTALLVLMKWMRPRKASTISFTPVVIGSMLTFTTIV